VQAIFPVSISRLAPSSVQFDRSGGESGGPGNTTSRPRGSTFSIGVFDINQHERSKRRQADSHFSFFPDDLAPDPSMVRPGSCAAVRKSADPARRFQCDFYHTPPTS